jgi:hypothetical protein
MLATLRVLIQQYKESELATRKKGILEVLRVFITASKNLYGSIENQLQNLGTLYLFIALKCFFLDTIKAFFFYFDFIHRC